MFHVLKADSFGVSFYGWPNADRFLQAYRAAGFRVSMDARTCLRKGGHANGLNVPPT